MKQWIKRSGLAVAILGLGLLIAACGQQRVAVIARIKPSQLGSPRALTN